MTANDEAAELAEFNELVRSTPLHAHMGLKCLEYGPHTVVTMELTDSVRGFAPGSVHGGMLATLADAASAWTLWGAFESGAEIPVTTDLHIRYYRQPMAGPLTAEANLVHRGRRLVSCDVPSPMPRTESSPAPRLRTCLFPRASD